MRTKLDSARDLATQFFTFIGLCALLALCANNVAAAKNHEVQLLTADGSGQTMVMSPGYLKIAKGDTVTFVPADVTHNVESVAIPSAAKKFSSTMGQKFTYTFDEQGVYLYKCTPHFVMGMLGVIQVDGADNLGDVKKQWETVGAGVVMNKERVASYLAQVK
ncbi:plastocyanin/azurin family copper-binding protein [Thalassotalea euphylliae]|uniref:Pseudoazurin n=1 Tax=Thalassotalea euphylliae TaxID=1655234 RepID=A0A3E0UGE9_9GAMM|nr:plastocyanin/azurin family copper-binding protein [Thalassotalea euphylliae]REL35235.1 pseudoazurin [Thalassotalea euphylliae]